jgi:hypothetical protein
MGGMGNQMFQHAAARAIARHHNCELRYDLSYMGHADQGTVRDFELHHFRGCAAPLNQMEGLRFGSQYRAPIFRRGLARLVRSINPHGWYEEPDIAFDPDSATIADNSVVVGRFQSYRYFEDIVDLIRSDFEMVTLVSGRCVELCKQARDAPSVGLHVRRTDYVDSEAYRQVIQALPLEYYARALDCIREILGTKVQLYIVSDDIAWCREQPIFRVAHTFVDLAQAAHPHIEEFEVLRSCRHFIISNSTFAWWAAWLGAAEDKQVIAPASWSHNPEFDSPDRVPNGWLRL